MKKAVKQINQKRVKIPKKKTKQKTAKYDTETSEVDMETEPSDLKEEAKQSNTENKQERQDSTDSSTNNHTDLGGLCIKQCNLYGTGKSKWDPAITN